MKNNLPVFMLSAAALLVLFQSSCSSVRPVREKEIGQRKEVRAAFARTPVRVDGKLDDDVWKEAVPYSLERAETAFAKSSEEVRKYFSKPCMEPGRVKVAWDDSFLYVGGEFTDSDVCAYGPEDQLHHYLLGDAFELFLKPENETWYWELYATPANRRTVFFYPSRSLCGVGLQSYVSPIRPRAQFAFRVAARTQGTLNSHFDRDRSWTFEMAVPRAELNKMGVALKPGVPWLIFLARINPSRYFPETSKENTSYPRQAKGNYHESNDYARLILVKGASSEKTAKPSSAK